MLSEIQQIKARTINYIANCLKFTYHPSCCHWAIWTNGQPGIVDIFNIVIFYRPHKACPWFLCPLINIISLKPWNRSKSALSRIFTELAHCWADSVFKLRCPSVFCMCVCLCHSHYAFLEYRMKVCAIDWFQSLNESFKNPAYGRHRISRPMRIVGPIQFRRGCVIYL